MELNDATIRDVLLRNIADRNKRIASIVGAICGGKGKEYSNCFSNMLRAFVGNNRQAMNNIEEIAESFGGRYAPYHFFDNDTLWAYDCFLGVLINELWGKRLTPADLDRAFNKAGQYMLQHSGSARSNYYNADRPITCAKKETVKGKEFAPRKPLTEKDFLKKYGVSSASCVGEVQKHFLGKKNMTTHSKATSPVAGEGRVDSSHTTSQDASERNNTIRYMYKGIECILRINSVVNYFGNGDIPVQYIEASSEDGSRLFTTRTLNNTVYNGALYDRNTLEFVPEESGEIFYPSAALEIKAHAMKKDKSKKTGNSASATEKSNNNATKNNNNTTKIIGNTEFPVYTDEDQMTLF